MGRNKPVAISAKRLPERAGVWRAHSSLVPYHGLVQMGDMDRPDDRTGRWKRDVGSVTLHFGRTMNATTAHQVPPLSWNNRGSIALGILKRHRRLLVKMSEPGALSDPHNLAEPGETIAIAV